MSKKTFDPKKMTPPKDISTYDQAVKDRFKEHADCAEALPNVKLDLVGCWLWLYFADKPAPGVRDGLKKEGWFFGHVKDEQDNKVPVWRYDASLKVTASNRKRFRSKRKAEQIYSHHGHLNLVAVGE